MRIGRRRDVLAAAVSHGILVYGKKVADLDPSEMDVLTDSMGVSQHVSDERRAALPGDGVGGYRRCCAIQDSRMYASPLPGTMSIGRRSWVQ